MMKRISAGFFAVLILCAAMLPCFAADRNQYYALTDDAEVFSASQTADLVSRLEEAAKATGWQMIIHTSNDGIYTDEDLESHYNNYYDSQGFEYDALMLVIDMGSNKRDILCYGDARAYFKDKSRYEVIKNAMRPYLNNRDMYNASIAFIDEAVTVHGMGKTSAFLLSLQKFGWIIGIVAVAAGVIIFFVVKSKYKNMGKAGTYDLNANSSVDLEDTQDDFVNQYTTVRTIRTDTDSSSGGGSSHSGGGNSSGGF